MSFTVGDVFYVFGIIFFFIASLFLLGANTQSVF
jgi:hypothetical protein